MTRLTTLRPMGCRGVGDLHLEGLTQLTSLNLAVCQQVGDLSPLAGLTQLTWLTWPVAIR